MRRLDKRKTTASGTVISFRSRGMLKQASQDIPLLFQPHTPKTNQIKSQAIYERLWASFAWMNRQKQVHRWCSVMTEIIGQWESLAGVRCCLGNYIHRIWLFFCDTAWAMPRFLRRQARSFPQTFFISFLKDLGNHWCGWIRPGLLIKKHIRQKQRHATGCRASEARNLSCNLSYNTRSIKPRGVWFCHTTKGREDFGVYFECWHHAFYHCCWAHSYLQ